MLPPGNVTFASSMLPLPLGVKPVAPPVCTAVYVTPISELGKVSTTDVPFAWLGPMLLATIV